MGVLSPGQWEAMGGAEWRQGDFGRPSIIQTAESRVVGRVEAMETERRWTGLGDGHKDERGGVCQGASWGSGWGIWGAIPRA